MNMQPASRTFFKSITALLLSVVWLMGGITFAQSQSTYSPSNAAPVVVPPITFFDINSGRFGKLEIAIDDGQFMDGAVDKLHLIAKKLDLSQGILEALEIDVKGGHFQDFIFDHLTISTKGRLNFNTGALLNNRMLEFISPVQAEVVAVVSQNSLNSFLNSPHTLNRLSVTAGRKAAFLDSLLGPGAGLITFSGGKVSLEPNNRMLLEMQSKLGITDMVLPLELSSQLSLKDGWIYFSDTHLMTSGQEISPQLSKAVVDKVNGLANWQQATDDLHFNFVNLEVAPADKFVLLGTAVIRRLRFGNNQI